MEKLIFQDENGESAEFYVMEQTRISGRNYLLVADSEEEDAECLILKDLAEEEDRESLYEIVENEQELDAVLKVFDELLEDVELTK
ncbi:MAG: DUF1292 domain-containing protein [Lachnospiraceae bacterium]|nr:DUF1292 domain-containing protein [Lachnospiraceae bacterium]